MVHTMFACCLVQRSLMRSPHLMSLCCHAIPLRFIVVTQSPVFKWRNKILPLVKLQNQQTICRVFFESNQTCYTLWKGVSIGERVREGFEDRLRVRSNLFTAHHFSCIMKVGSPPPQKSIPKLITVSCSFNDCSGFSRCHKIIKIPGKSFLSSQVFSVDCSQFTLVCLCIKQIFLRLCKFWFRNVLRPKDLNKKSVSVVDSNVQLCQNECQDNYQF